MLEATVIAVAPCPPIASGEGSVVTARIVTRQVDEIAMTKIRGLDGREDILSGTRIHPIWSVGREEWVPMGELVEGERLLGASGIAVVLVNRIVQSTTPVYNLEVHGEHVYQVGELCLLVHNSELICRIGGGSADNLAMSMAERGLSPPGISTLLANSADEAAQLMRNAFPTATQLAEKARTIGTSTIDEIRDVGYDVIFDSTRKLPDTHYRLFHPDGVDAFMHNIDELAGVFINATGH